MQACLDGVQNSQHQRCFHHNVVPTPGPDKSRQGLGEPLLAVDGTSILGRVLVGHPH